jgi:hypothetical protein
MIKIVIYPLFKPSTFFLSFYSKFLFQDFTNTTTTNDVNDITITETAETTTFKRTRTTATTTKCKYKVIENFFILEC